jgi:hypothetical protein
MSRAHRTSCQEAGRPRRLEALGRLRRSATGTHISLALSWASQRQPYKIRRHGGRPLPSCLCPIKSAIGHKVISGAPKWPLFSCHRHHKRRSVALKARQHVVYPLPNGGLGSRRQQTADCAFCNVPKGAPSLPYDCRVWFIASKLGPQSSRHR